LELSVLAKTIEKTRLCLYALGLGLTLVPSWSNAEDAAKTAHAPVAWGLTSGAKHCVIFKESQKTTGAFFIVAATLKTVGKLTVIESGDFKFDPQTYIEEQTTMNSLQTRALNERLRFVKIPDQYTPDELQAAHALCKKPNLLISDDPAPSSLK